jgi:hypothetical protein
VRAVAPALALVLVYFGLGSMVLATEILVRFHAALPDATETQFTSGVGHLFVAALGIAALFPHLRRRDARTWLVANTLAIAYWALQLALLSPPWLAFGGQEQLARPIAFATLSACGTLTLVIAVGRRLVAVR